MGVLSVVQVKNLFIPCIVLESRGRRFLVDNYFIDNLEYPHRRALLIYKVEGMENPAFGRGVILEGKYELNSIVNLFRESYEWIQSTRLNKAIDIYKDFKISLIAPVKLYRKLVREPEEKKVSDWEINGAQLILEGVFGRDELLSKKAMKASMVMKAYVKVMVNESGEEVEMRSRNKQVEKAYNWLYKSDSVFRRELKSIL